LQRRRDGGIQGRKEAIKRGTSKTETGRKPAYLRDVVERFSGAVEATSAVDLQVNANEIWDAEQSRVLKIRPRISDGVCRRWD
jgi:hypothetical protein